MPDLLHQSLLDLYYCSRSIPMLSSNPLTVARQKLQSTDVPMVLRVSSYLRLSCSALNSDSIRYSRLMQALYTENSAWLDTCVVTSVGTVRSNHPVINELLKPITALHQADQWTQLQTPLAA
jgi:hypothetical protein